MIERQDILNAIFIIDWDKTTVLRKRDPTKAKVTRSDAEISAARRVSIE